MKRFILTTFALLGLAGSAWASAELVKERAKQQRDINNQQQGVVAPAPNAPGAAAPSGPQGLSPEQQRAVDKLTGDLSAIKAGASVSDGQKTTMRIDILTLAKGAVKPSSVILAKLVGDLTGGLADKSAATRDNVQLAKDINIVVNSGSLTASRAQIYVTATQNLLKLSSVPDQNLQAVVTDLKSVVTELQKSKPKLYQ